METVTLLETVLYRFRDLFGSQNFSLFCAYIYGVILCETRQCVTQIYRASGSNFGFSYWSLVKFLSRGVWDWQRVCARLIEIILSYVSDRLYLYDHTYAIKTGKKQFGLRFFRNYRYVKGNTNQSKFHWGHQFAGLGILGLCGSSTFFFPVWVRLLSGSATDALRAFKSAIKLLPCGLIVFDRGFNNRKYFKALIEQGHHLLCRVRKNAAFYYPAPKKPIGKRGRQPIYGRRAHFQHWSYHPVYVNALDKTFDIAHRIVRSKMCPQPVHLIVIRTKPKKSYPYRYFLVFTTDLTLSVEQIVYYYTLRWKIETGFRDCKQSFGFDHYRVQGKKAIQRSVVLSFIGTSLTQLMVLPHVLQVHHQTRPDLKRALKEMNIHWYDPKRWTLGLVATYLRWQMRHQIYAASLVPNKNATYIPEHCTDTYTKAVA